MTIQRVSDIRDQFATKYINKEYVTDKTGCDTIEIVGQSFIADEDTIFGKPNINYIKRELEWYYSMSLNVNDIPDGTPEIWKSVATKDGFINSNYGWCVFSEANGSQYYRVINELRNNKDSRRAIIIYTRPSMWVDYNRDGMSDFMCTNTVQYLIRNDKLIGIVNMRSNDVWAGYRNDFAWQRHIHNGLSVDLGVQPGDIIWNAGSLHCYSKDFGYISSYVNKRDYLNKE